MNPDFQGLLFRSHKMTKDKQTLFDIGDESQSSKTWCGMNAVETKASYK